jgi:hypothetical protein
VFGYSGTADRVAPGSRNGHLGAYGPRKTDVAGAPRSARCSGVFALEKRVPGAFSRRPRMPLAAVPTTVEARVVRLRLASQGACRHTVFVVLVRALARTRWTPRGGVVWRRCGASLREREPRPRRVSPRTVSAAACAPGVISAHMLETPPLAAVAAGVGRGVRGGDAHAVSQTGPRRCTGHATG